jgi:hypothetical protein
MNTAEKNENAAQPEGGCCGGPAREDTSACCAKDENAKTAGLPGCGCRDDKTEAGASAQAAAGCCDSTKGESALPQHGAGQPFQKLKFVKKKIPAWASGEMQTPSGTLVFRAESAWSRADYWGMIKSRIGAFRMTYSVSPGLCAVGSPTKESDIFVSANYKLSFDILRRSLAGMNAWILVLDTKSINVWCAAGKGTFGTDELVKQISEAKLDAVVNHRRVIVPQLGAVGVNAAEVMKKTGFRVAFGPVQATDIPAYVTAGYKKTREMRTIEFSSFDRLILTPMEINPAMKKFPWFAGGFLLLFGLEPAGILFRNAWFSGRPFLLLLLLAVMSGAFITPLLLPVLPFRSFAMKGWFTGIAVTAVGVTAANLITAPLLLVTAAIFFPALSSYIALQFTGSTTFTGMSGVKKELKIAMPVYFAAAGVSALLLVIFKLKEWGLV